MLVMALIKEEAALAGEQLALTLIIVVVSKIITIITEAMLTVV